MEKVGTYDYAGFVYTVMIEDDGDVRMVPEEGQHKAARKEKHIRAARECYLEDWEQSKTRRGK
jgi:hypothetical protein